MRSAPPGYAVLRELAAGMWEAVDANGQHVALGFGGAWSPALTKVRSPHVATVHAVGEHEGASFIVHALGAQTAREWLAAGKRTDTEIIRVWWNATTGLAALHREGIAHGRVSPDHLFVEPEGRAFVGAFARDLAAPSPYLAPELATGRAPTERSDQFGVCASLAEMMPRRNKKLAAVLERGLAPDPSTRFGTISALGTMLTRT